MALPFRPLKVLPVTALSTSCISLTCCVPFFPLLTFLASVIGLSALTFQSPGCPSFLLISLIALLLIVLLSSVFFWDRVHTLFLIKKKKPSLGDYFGTAVNGLKEGTESASLKVTAVPGRKG